ncbi:MAG TPA: STY0301 family protein [Telluria sp.]|nr:STY0301 family protein [Telluria sp.]
MRPALAALWLSLAIPGLSHAERVTIDCPRTVTLNETVTASYPGWESMIDKGNVAYALETMRVYSGHPSRMANLIPSKLARIKGLRITSWQLPPDVDGYWVTCAYQNAMTVLVKPLPATIQSCRLAEKTMPSGALAGIDSFICE